jgi:hypothetical protein
MVGGGQPMQSVMSTFGRTLEAAAAALRRQEALAPGPGGPGRRRRERLARLEHPLRRTGCDLSHWRPMMLKLPGCFVATMPARTLAWSVEHCSDAECEPRSREFQDAIYGRRVANPKWVIFRPRATPGARSVHPPQQRTCSDSTVMSISCHKQASVLREQKNC